MQCGPNLRILAGLMERMQFPTLKSGKRANASISACQFLGELRLINLGGIRKLGISALPVSSLHLAQEIGDGLLWCGRRRSQARQCRTRRNTDRATAATCPRQTHDYEPSRNNQDQYGTYDLHQRTSGNVLLSHISATLSVSASPSLLTPHPLHH